MDSMFQQHDGTIEEYVGALAHVENQAGPASPRVDFRRLTALTELAESAVDANAIGH